MATITGFTAARMLDIENNSIVDGAVVGDDLILERHSGATINAGSVRGPTGSPGATLAELDDRVPVGVIQDYIGTVAPNALWLLMQGQTISGGASSYPDLWAILPASMKSGSDIVFPDTRGKMAVAYNSADASFDTIGETGGAKTHTLTQAELPNVTLSIDPPATTVTITDPGHNHSQNAHNHTQNSHNHAQDAHVHTDSAGHIHANQDSPAAGSPYFLSQDLTSGSSGIVTTNLGATIWNSDSTAVAHVYMDNATATNQATTATNNAATATNNAAATGITATVNIAAFNSPALGSGNAHNNMPPYIVFQKMIRAL